MLCSKAWRYQAGTDLEPSFIVVGGAVYTTGGEK